MAKKIESKLQHHIENKKQVLEEMYVPEDVISSIPWSRFQNETQVDNHCRPIIFSSIPD